MKKIISIILFIVALLFLIAALTDLFPSNVFQKHKLIVAILFIALTGFILRANNRLGKN